jgi:hypothetical protein
MGMTVTIDENFHQQKHYAMAELAQIRDGLEDELRAELDAVMQKILATAIDLCPKDSGALASSINLDSGTIEAGDFYGNSIYAGDPNITNPKTGKSTNTYAQLVHDGHVMRDGSFYEGVPFLTEALLTYEAELESAVDRALKELGSIEPSGSDIARMSD